MQNINFNLICFRHVNTIDQIYSSDGLFCLWFINNKYKDLLQEPHLKIEDLKIRCARSVEEVDITAKTEAKFLMCQTN